MKVARIEALCAIAFLVIGISGQVLAQSSSAQVIPQEDGQLPVPTTSLNVADDNYPFDSLISNEEGTATLRMLLDSAGHPTEIRLVKTSGFPKLDLRAAEIAQKGWTFQPGTDMAVVAVNWKLPYAPVNDYIVKVPPPPSAIAVPKAVTDHLVRAEDYPPLSIRAGELELSACATPLSPTEELAASKLLNLAGRGAWTMQP